MESDLTKRLMQEAKNADDYFSKFEAPEPHFRPMTRGKLHKVQVITEICHQASPSAQNYWKSADFDRALAQVIEDQFTLLGQLAVELLEKRAKNALLSEESLLRERLAQIEALKAEAAA